MTTWRYTLPAHPDDRELIEARLWAAGAIGVWEQSDAVAGWFEAPDADVQLGGTWLEEPDVDWQASWKATVAPVLAGPVAIVPTWLADTWARPAGLETVVVLDPGQAFGSGHHATTTLCTEDLAGMDLTGKEVFDVGTGTGVLAIVAAARGARRVVAVDIDAHAMEVTAQNVLANGQRWRPLSDPARDDDEGVELELAVGSADATDDTFDVVVANLMTDVIAALAADLAARVRPGGLLVVSGIHAPRAERPAARLAAAGLTLRSSRVRDDWVGAVWSRPAT